MFPRSRPGVGPPDGRMRRYLLLAVLAYALVFSAYSLLRYYSFRTLYFDLGIFSGSMSQVTHGSDSLASLLLPSSPGHVGHFAPVLAIPLALYALLPSPATLLVFQSLLLAVAALPLFDLARAALGRADQALALALAYLLYAPLQGVNRYDFHVEAFVPLFAFEVLLALVRGRYRTFLAASALLLCTHEFLSVVYVWTGVLLVAYHLVTRKDVVRGLVPRRCSLTVLALGAGFLALEELLNEVLTPTHASVFGWLSTTTSTFSGGGSLLAGVGTDVLMKVVYWILLLAPLLFLPLREWRLSLPAVPWLALTVFGSNSALYSIYSQYPALVLPVLFFAAAMAMRRPRPVPLAPWSGRRLALALVGSALVVSAVASPLSPLNPYDGALSLSPVPAYPPVVTAHDHATARLLGLVPEGAGVLAQNELYSQLSDRAAPAPFWNLSARGPPSYIAVDTMRIWYGVTVPPYPEALAALVPRILANASYAVAGFSDAAFVYRLGGDRPPSLASEVASVPRTPTDLSGNWTTENATTSADAVGLHLAPAAGSVGFAWTGLGRAAFLLSADLAWPAGPPGEAFSGVRLGPPGTNASQLLYVHPSAGEVRWTRTVNGSPRDTAIGVLPASATSVRFTVLVSGGTFQVWADGRQLLFLTAFPLGTVTSVGLESFSQPLDVPAFAVFESTAAQAPPGAEVPWDGLVAVAGFVPTVVGALWLAPRYRPALARAGAQVLRALRRGR